MRNRDIFKYNNGTRDVAADPLAIQRKLMTNPDFNVEYDLKVMQTSKPEALEALGRFLTAARAAFAVEEFHIDDQGNERGLLDEEVIILTHEYGAYMESLKKKELN